MGDPAGVGLELVARVWSERRADTPRFTFHGDADALERAAARAGLPKPALNPIARGEDAAPEGERLDVVSVPLAVEETPGKPDPINAAATIAAIKSAAACARAGAAAALVTLPIAKAVLHEAGFGFPGHTEFIAHLLNDAPWPHARGPVMMLAGASLKVALVTIHTPLAEVARTLNRQGIVRVGRVVHEALRRDFAIAQPRIALCGLNPHAGEQGHIGREEIEIIDPAAAALRAEGVDITDARPADLLFHQQARAGYDAVIALYHDQGLIPLKALHFWDAVNLTLGLPIVRTSPDHGVGFDIAGQGKARADSFIAALKLAREMAARRASA